MSIHDVQNRYLDVCGRRVHVAESPGRRGPPVVFFHGNSSSAASFDRLLGGSMGQDHPLIAVDFPGHGTSDRSTDLADYSLGGLGRFVRAIFTAMGIREYVLCGHSLGGHVLSQVAPELNGALGFVLISAPPLSPTNLGSVFLPDPTSGALFRGQLNAREVQTLATCLVKADRVDERVIAALAKTIAATDEAFRPALGRSLAAGEVGDERGLLAAAGVPVAFCFGARDPFLRPPTRDSMPSLPLQQIWRFEEAGHSPHIETPTMFEELLQTFLLRTAAAWSRDASS